MKTGTGTPRRSLRQNTQTAKKQKRKMHTNTNQTQDQQQAEFNPNMSNSQRVFQQMQQKAQQGAAQDSADASTPHMKMKNRRRKVRTAEGETSADGATATGFTFASHQKKKRGANGEESTGEAFGSSFSFDFSGFDSAAQTTGRRRKAAFGAADAAGAELNLDMDGSFAHTKKQRKMKQKFGAFSTAGMEGLFGEQSATAQHAHTTTHDMPRDEYTQEAPAMQMSDLAVSSPNKSKRSQKKLKKMKKLRINWGESTDGAGGAGGALAALGAALGAASTFSSFAGFSSFFLNLSEAVGVGLQQQQTDEPVAQLVDGDNEEEEGAPRGDT